jgi:2'-5' RNA ligase
MEKYFLAIVIPQPQQAEIEKIKTSLLDEHGLKGALRSPAHITLHRPFEWKSGKENMLIDRLRDFRFDKAFDIQLKDFGAFEPRVIYVNVLQNETLGKLHPNLKRFAQKELRLMNEVNDLRAFHPHVTIAFRDLRKNRFEAIWEEFRNRKFDASFSCGGFSLLRLEDRWQEVCFFDFKG